MTSTQRETIQAMEMKSELQAKTVRRCEHCYAEIPQAGIVRILSEGLNQPIHCDDCGLEICTVCGVEQVDGAILCTECAKRED